MNSAELQDLTLLLAGMALGLLVWICIEALDRLGADQEAPPAE